MKSLEEQAIQQVQDGNLMAAVSLLLMAVKQKRPERPKNWPPKDYDLYLSTLFVTQNKPEAG